MANYGLIGRNISYSFSKTFFAEKFERENRPDVYSNFDIPDLRTFPKIIAETPNLQGLNVTIPYKEAIMPYLDTIDPEAAKIGAVNTIKITESNQLIGFNTDHVGFSKSLERYLPLTNKNALVLGTGGASKAVAYVLERLGFQLLFISRKPGQGQKSYMELTKDIIESHSLIVNTTPLGTHPKIDECPDIPYQFLGKNHLLYDLIYNPAETEFLKRGKAQESLIQNGLSMLQLQAEEAWRIWNETE
ncbi:MAG: shikimate dehydrogenase [Flavobacteriaceae bacterium]|nr:shikimate dehydrogenase [Flavobacteriaceae bacterium]